MQGEHSSNPFKKCNGELEHGSGGGKVNSSFQCARALPCFHGHLLSYAALHTTHIDTYSEWDRWPAGTTALTSSGASYCRVFCFDAASYCKTPTSSAPRCMNLGSMERDSWSSSSGWRITKLLWDLHSLLPERKEISLQWWCFPLSNWPCSRMDKLPHSPYTKLQQVVDD